nr:hypothetical protein [Tanacetum cinerariifolium]
MMTSSPICLLSKASNTKSWLWHRRLSHLNFGTINHLVRHGLVRGLPKLKFEKDHLCSACVMGKSMKKPYKPKSEDTNQEKLYLLHMDLCGPMRIASVNRKKYILVIVDDYSRFTWVGISHETSVAHSPQQNGVVKIRNRTLIKAARTMLIYVKDPLFLWAEAVATACYTQNLSIIRLRHGITPYELLHDKLLNLSFFHVFVAPEPTESTGLLSSTTVDQDAPSPSNSQTTPKTQSPVISNDAEEENHDLDISPMNNDLLFRIPILENVSESSSSDVIPTIVHTATPNSEHVTKWTKDQPLENLIDELERPTYKDTLTQLCWIEAMQEELDEFECLEVWELVHRLDKVMVITLKWIYKVKINELGGILKNKGRLVTHGHRQEEGVDFEESFAPVARLDTIRIFLTFPAHMNMIVYQMDIKMAFCEKKFMSANQTESLKIYGMKSSDPVDTPMVEKSKLDKDTQGKAVDPTHYCRMIGTLMSLTSSRPDLTFAVCMCARQNWRDLPRDITLDSVEVLRYDDKRSKRHKSDTKVITMKMEILLEPTSNKLMVGYLKMEVKVPDFSCL